MTVTLPHEWARIHAEADPDAPAVVFLGGAMSYGELDLRADEYAGQVTDVGPGRLVPIDATSTPETVIALVGLHRSGAVPVPYGPHTVDTDDPTPPDAYVVMPTSGTFGHPRGVILTEQNVAASVEASQRRLGNGPGDRWLLTLPLFHVGGLSIVWRSLTAGGSIEIHPRFDVEAAVTALHGSSITFASFVPTMLHRILECDAGPYRGLKAVLLGGAPASPDLVERAMSAGLPVLHTYGMTEAGSQVATVEPGTAAQALGTAGPPLDGFVVSASDGEILIDGPAVFPGYLGEPPRIGPFRTGDLGHIDQRGRLVVIGRKRGVIITGGENVHAASVEAAIDSVSSVGGCVVVGLPSAEWGEIVAAVVEAAPSDLPKIEAEVRRRVASHEVPRRWVTVESLPRLPNGKPDRAAAAKLAAIEG